MSFVELFVVDLLSSCVEVCRFIFSLSIFVSIYDDPALNISF